MLPAGLDDSRFVAARKDQQRSVRGGHVIEKHRDIHGAGLGYVVVVSRFRNPGAIARPRRQRRLMR